MNIAILITGYTRHNIHVYEQLVQRSYINSLPANANIHFFYQLWDNKPYTDSMEPYIQDYVKQNWIHEPYTLDDFTNTPLYAGGITLSQSDMAEDIETVFNLLDKVVTENYTTQSLIPVKAGGDVMNYYLYSHVLNHLSQFYSLHHLLQHVLASDIEFDYIIRGRYDTIIGPTLGKMFANINQYMNNNQVIVANAGRWSHDDTGDKFISLTYELSEHDWEGSQWINSNGINDVVYVLKCNDHLKFVADKIWSTSKLSWALYSHWRFTENLEWKYTFDTSAERILADVLRALDLTLSVQWFESIILRDNILKKYTFDELLNDTFRVWGQQV